MTTTINASASSGLVQTADTSTILQLQTASTAALTIDSSQNVGIGTTSPTNLGATFKTLELKAGSSSAGGGYYLTGNGTVTAQLGVDTLTSYIGTRTAHPVVFTTTNTERMRIDSSGDTTFNTSSVSQAQTYKFYGYGSGILGTDLQLHNQGGNAEDFTRISMYDTGSIRTALDFRVLAGGNGYLTYSSGSGTVTERFRVDQSGGFILAGSTAQKATGTTWSNPSDQRLKDNIRDYAKGIAELMQVRVREWEYNGKGGTTEGMKGLGVIADEVMTVLPNTVENYEAKLNADDEEPTAIKKFDATEITWLLVKTVQEQQALITAQAETINALTARIVALEGQ